MAGRFTWFDLMTTKPEDAIAFYSQGLGLKSQVWSGPMAYTMLVSGGETFGGVMQLPPEATAGGAPPHWLGYVGVDDLDASCAKATSLGAKILMTQEVPNTGRFAVMHDPQGAVVAMFQGATPPTGDGSLKAVAWHELMTSDPEGALAFYSELFGWQKTEAMDMGPMGTYQMFGANDHSFGGVMSKPPQLPVPAWAYYLQVDDVPARIEALKALGATLANGPHEVPGGMLVANLFDPQGAGFSIHGPGKG